jgi:hypothetical protein
MSNDENLSNNGSNPCRTASFPTEVPTTASRWKLVQAFPHGFQGQFYPSTRQRCFFGSTYKSSTRQVTRQKPSATRQVSCTFGVQKPFQRVLFGIEDVSKESSIPSDGNLELFGVHEFSGHNHGHLYLCEGCPGERLRPIETFHGGWVWVSGPVCYVDQQVADPLFPGEGDCLNDLIRRLLQRAITGEPKTGVALHGFNMFKSFHIFGPCVAQVSSSFPSRYSNCEK